MLSDRDFEELMEEADAFKLAIRGHSELESIIDSAVASAFEREVKMRSLGGFATRLRLATALGVVRPELRPAIDAVTDLRNDFAHGAISDLSRDRADSLLDALTVLPDEHRRLVERGEPIWTLRVVLIALRAVLRYLADRTQRLREEQERALDVEEFLRKHAQEYMERQRAQSEPPSTKRQCRPDGPNRQEGDQHGIPLPARAPGRDACGTSNLHDRRSNLEARGHDPARRWQEPPGR